MRCAVIDGYVDEPAVLGVPPYISTYVRYVAGAFLLRGYSVDYFTIDQVRTNDLWNAFSGYDVLVVVGGVTVPGRYVGGTPVSPQEVQKLFELNRKPYRIIVGAIGRAHAGRGGSVAKSFTDKVEFEEFVENIPLWFDENDYFSSLRAISLAGAEIVKQHPRFPNVICELEVSLGCERRTFCTFCTEPILHPRFFSRPVKDIVDEVNALYKVGVRAFRLGRSANIIAYGSDWNGGIPNVTALEELYTGIRESCPELHVLHTDNANPVYIAKHLELSARIIETIVKHNTSGDILSFGVESFDETVRKKNNIDGGVSEVDLAVKIVNEIGSVRDKDGVPKLLPGINLIFGLFGETKKTYETNYQKLLEYLNMGLLLRRINLRQIMIFPGTPLYYLAQRKTIKVEKRLFEHYKHLIRTNVDNPMLKRVFPIGTVIRNVIPEYREGRITFGRPLGTYPILVGVPANFEKPVDVVIVDHGQRSVTAVRKAPLEELTLEELESIPGIGKKNALRIKMKDFSALSDSTKEFINKFFLPPSVR
ncbi:radical SAM protein [Fervidobacterium thailandense]|uniref:Radical SAM protein n=1 Tax=Fervidobacterium thailandense TaxID=1008305 RepID=A0A1E3G0W3_9BACT|nr:radical SAM protein [Fervidobacterium thailandense]ODN29865.1 radical SAM protein [Fervidobacterium thailandense]